MSDPIRISRDELDSPKVDEVLSKEAVFKGSWGDGGDGEQVGKVKRTGRGGGKGKGLYLHAVLLTGFLAMAGSLLGWAIIEPFMNDEETSQNFLFGLIESSAQIALIIGLSAFLLSASDGLLSRAWSRMASTAGMGLGIGLIGGIVAAVVANVLYMFGIAFMMGFGIAVSSPEEGSFPFWLTVGNMSIRASAWCVFGLATGLAPGLLQKSRDLMTVGVLGGIIGGFLGGLFFDPIAHLTDGGLVSRAVGFGLMGLLTGLAIGLIEQLSKDAWLYMEAGPLVGKQFVLYKDPTKVGSSPKCDIFVFKDPEVSPEHAFLTRVGGSHEIESVGESPVIVNGKRVGRQRLEDGDQIRIGKAAFRYYVRKKKKKAIR